MYHTPKHYSSWLVLAALCLLVPLRGNSQLFQQDLSASTTVSNYVNSTTPTNGQWTAIGSSGGGVSVIIDGGGGNNKLRFTRATTSAGSATRNVDFSPTPSSLMLRFDMTVLATTNTTTAATWLVGGGLTNSNSTGSNSITHSRIGVNFSSTTGDFALRHISGSQNSTTFSGTQTITWVINNSGGTLIYRGPDGSQESVGDDVADVWVGTVKVFNDIAALTASQTLTRFKFVVDGGSGSVDLDNFLIDPIPVIPTIGAPDNATQNSFQANWNTVAGVTGYSIDVSTSPTFTTFVPGYENLYVAGQTASSTVVTGLDPATIYYYRVRGTAQYAVGSFSGGNSGSASIGTLIGGNNTSVQFSGTSAVVSEGSGSVLLTLSITEPSQDDPTLVDVVLTSGNAARVNGFSSSTITFPAGSAVDQQVSITISDDLLCNGDADLTFELQNISGGQGTPQVGFFDTFELTIEDDDFLVAPSATPGTAVGSFGFTANWDAVPGATGYLLDVSLLPGFGTPGGTLVEWNFPNNPDDALADGGIPANATREIGTVGANTPTFGVTGFTTNAATASGWSSGDGSKWWEVDLSTEGYTGISVSSRQQSSGTGPRDFRLEYRIGATGSWVAVTGGDVTVANNMTTGVLSDVALPEECNDRPLLFLRWIMTSNTNVGGSSSVSGAGTSRIDDIVVAGAFQPSFVAGYEALPVAGTSQTVAGLDASTTYYYRVRAEGGGCPVSENSNTVSVTTAGPPIDVNLELRTPDGNSDEISWEIVDLSNSAVCEGGAYSSGITNSIVESCSLPPGCYRLRVYDSAEDGFGTAGGYQLRLTGADPANIRIIDNMGNFNDGLVSAIGSGPSDFCLPMSTQKPIFVSRDKLDWVSNQYLVAEPDDAVSAEWIPGAPNNLQSATTGYQFWFFDPNGTYSFRRGRAHNTSDNFGPASEFRACHMRINNWAVANQIPDGVLMNVRIRSRVNGVYGAFGPAYRFKIDAQRALCPLTKLNDIPDQPALSCNSVRNWGPGNFVHARQVSGANRYQFRFRIPAEGYIKVVTSNTYFLQLNWLADPLEPGKTYEVQVRASKDGGATWCASGAVWGESCTLTINDLAQAGQQNLGLGNSTNGSLVMWPNPNRGDQLWIDLNGVDADVASVAVDIFDMTGKQIVARILPTQGDRSNTVLNLSGDLATGMYLVNITAGQKRYTERLVIAR